MFCRLFLHWFLPYTNVSHTFFQGLLLADGIQILTMELQKLHFNVAKFQQCTCVTISTYFYSNESCLSLCTYLTFPLSAYLLEILANLHWG